MAVEFFIPKLGQTVDEVTIIDWLVEDGDTVEQGQPVIEVETDKAVFPVEATASGIIHLGPYTKGDVVPVVTTVAVIGKPGDRYPTAAGALPAAVVVAAVPESGSPKRVSSSGTDGLSPTADGLSEKVFASPRARRLALEKA